MKDFEEFRETVARSMGVVFLLTIPSSIGLVVLGESIIGAIYEDGKFQAYDTQQTGKALAYYAIGLAGYSAVKILNPAFYALGDSRTPMLVSLGSILINYLTVWTLINKFHFGHEGLALSTSVVALASFVGLGLILRARLNGIHGWRVVSSIMRTLSASMIMGAAVAASSALVHRLMGEGRAVPFVDLLVSLPVGLVVFWFAAKWFQVQELEVTSNTFLKPLKRRVKWLG
jgi:putative peptidoglycan lipid II flippase